MAVAGLRLGGPNDDDGGLGGRAAMTRILEGTVRHARMGVMVDFIQRDGEIVFSSSTKSKRCQISKSNYIGRLKFVFLSGIHGSQQTMPRSGFGLTRSRTILNEQTVQLILNIATFLHGQYSHLVFDQMHISKSARKVSSSASNRRNSSKPPAIFDTCQLIEAGKMCQNSQWIHRGKRCFLLFCLGRREIFQFVPPAHTICCLPQDTRPLARFSRLFLCLWLCLHEVHRASSTEKSHFRYCILFK